MPKLIAGHTLINYDENVSRVVIPKFVFAIADRAFSERGQIKAIEMGESVKSIGNFAFRMCYSMKEMSLGRVYLRIAGLLKGLQFQKELRLLMMRCSLIVTL